MASVYLETSFVSACVNERTDAASMYQRERSREWWASQRTRHLLLASAEVVREISDPAFRHASAAAALIADVQLIPIDEAVRGTAKILVREHVMPGGSDALHVAAACVRGAEYMLSWNVRHLANTNKVAHLRRVCTRLGLLPPQIVTPELLWEGDHEPD